MTKKEKHLYNNVRVAMDLARARNQGRGQYFAYHVDRLGNVTSIGFFNSQSEAEMAYTDYVGGSFK